MGKRERKEFKRVPPNCVKLPVAHFKKKLKNDAREWEGMQPRTLPPEDWEAKGEEDHTYTWTSNEETVLTVVDWVKGESRYGMEHSCKTFKAQKKLWQWWDQVWIHTPITKHKKLPHIFREHNKMVDTWGNRGVPQQSGGSGK